MDFYFKAKKKGLKMKNELLKPLVKEIVGLVGAGEAAAAKDWSKVFSLLIQEGVELPAIISGWSNLMPELEALLVDPSADADLLAYTMTLISGESDKAKAIIAASADLALSLGVKGAALVKAIKS